MPRVKYRAITLPDGLYQALEQYLRDSEGQYVSIAEIVREALRDFLKKQQQ